MKRFLLLATAALAVDTVNAQQAVRVPLLEVFTSATCPPCNPGNTVYENVLTGKPATDYVSIKYQQNFPGSGDPYCTTEGVNRRGYYAINSIPRMEINGAWDQNAQSFTNAIYTQYQSVAPQYNLSGTFSIKNKVVTAKVKYAPLVAVPAGAKLYVAIVESQTVQNVKSNGETKFYNVMKKMLPTETGTALTQGTVGVYDSTTLTFTFTGNFRLPADGQPTNRINNATEYSVENFNNLKMVAWLQGADKTVYQAGNLTRVAPADVAAISGTVGEVSVYPNPSSEMLNLDVTMKEGDNVTAVLYSMTGAVVDTRMAVLGAGKSSLSFNTSLLAAGMYNLVILDSKNNSFVQRVVVSH